MDARDFAQMTAEAMNSLEGRIDSRIAGLERKMDDGFRQMGGTIREMGGEIREMDGKIDRNQRIIEQKTDDGFRQIVDYLDRRLPR